MGTVYSAHDTVLDRSVAIKLIRDDIANDAKNANRFTQEAKTIAQLSANPHILTIFDFGLTVGGQAYIVTEHLQGRTLKSVLKDAYLPARSWVVDMGVQIASAVADMHSKGFAHGDVKPSNIFMVQTETLAILSKLIDFGLSHSPRWAGTQSHGPAIAAGTPAYAAPEIMAGQPPSCEADMYGFGLVLYEAATGKHPFSDKSPRDWWQYSDVSTVVSFPDISVPYPASFQALVFAMLEREPSARPSGRDCLRRLWACSRELAASQQ
jgi:serine/threonine-protein kinase